MKFFPPSPSLIHGLLGRPRNGLCALLGLMMCAALARAVAPLADGFTVVYHNPDREQYVEGCGLVRLGPKTFCAVVPVVPRVEWSEERRATQSRIHIVKSADGGTTWRQASELPYYSAVPWIHDGRLYLFAMKGGTTFRNDDILLLRSDDGGATWTDPVTLFKGHYWNCHTGMVVHKNRLYWAVDDISFGMIYRGPCVVSADLSTDLMKPSAWRISNPVPFVGIPETLTNPRFAQMTSQYLEPNVIVLNDRIRLLAVVKPKRQSTAGLAAVFDLEDNANRLELRFTQFNPMPGGQVKFCVIRDDVSRMFWATVNLPADSQSQFDWLKDVYAEGKFKASSAIGGNDRRFLMLMYSMDGLSWFQAGCIAQARKMSQSFMYATPVIDSDDLAIIARTAIDAPNHHDADHATFHRVKNFRSLALSLTPDPERK